MPYPDRMADSNIRTPDITSEMAGRRLHFIVRHDEYKQTIGYPYLLDHVLHNLNNNLPGDARELLTRTASRLAHKPKNTDISKRKDDLAQLPYLLPAYMQNDAKSDRLGYFGPAAENFFGRLQYDLREELEEEAGSPDVPVGIALHTKIFFASRGKPYRGYLDTFKHYYPNEDPSTCMLAFDYPIPGLETGAGQTLPLMRIGQARHLSDEMKSHYTGEAEAIEHRVTLYTHRFRDDLIFLHPECDRIFFNKLVKCLDPLLKTIDASPEHPVEPGASPPQEKIDAAATMYWLLAQSTPVVRGGSAYANVILEHVTHRLRGQGYDYTLPYTQEGVDLWAHAALLPLEDTPQMKGFRSRFREGQFHDRSVQDHEVEEYVRNCVAAQFMLRIPIPMQSMLTTSPASASRNR